MDLDAIHFRNPWANKLTRLSMAICFLVAGGLLLGTLAVATPDADPAHFEISTPR